MYKGKLKKVFEKDPPVAGFIGMLPTRRILRPIFKRFFKLNLHTVDHLSTRTLYHHFVLTAVRGVEQLETRWNASDLHSVILPHAEYVILASVILPDAFRFIVDPIEDRV